MVDEQIVPVWTLSSGGADDALVAQLQGPDQELSGTRLSRLRAALTALSDDPPVVLERHAVTPDDLPDAGRVVAAASPLARSLAEIIGSTRRAGAAESAAGTTEVLYRMIVPQRLAGQLAQGAARPMSAGGNAIYGAIRDRTQVVGQARFVPVSAGAAAGGVAAAGGAGVVGAVVAAAPVVLLLAATAGSIHAEEQRRRALERVEDALNDLKEDSLDKERDELNGAVGAIAKATALLADEGRLGVSLGLDSAVNRIDTALSRAERRVGEWERTLDGLGTAATPKDLQAAFAGIEAEGGEFEAKLRMAGFAIAMKRRVAILQAAEHTQADTKLSLSRFNRELARDTGDLDRLEQRMAIVLERLSEVLIKTPDRRRGIVYLPAEVRELLQWTPRLRRLAVAETPAARTPGDVELRFVARDDGSILVLPPRLEQTSSPV
jgi:hypothetical protein